MSNSISISILGKVDGFYNVKTKRPFRTETDLMTYERYKEHISGFQNYCTHKGYNFKCDDIDEFVNGLSKNIIKQKEHDTTYYLNVESHYHEHSDARGQNDAVMFEMCQESNTKHETDALITCSVEDAKAFAHSILRVCKEIEGKK